MTDTVNPKKRPSKFVAIVGVVVTVLLIALAAVALTNVSKQQDRESLAHMKNEHLAALLVAKEKLPTAVDAYLAAYQKALNAEGSREKAERASKDELDAFTKAEASARLTMTKLRESRGAGHDDVRDAVAQFDDSYLGYVDYMAGLVVSYPQFSSLWGDDEAPCQGIFIGDKSSSLTERDELLSENNYTARIRALYREGHAS